MAMCAGPSAEGHRQINPRSQMRSSLLLVGHTCLVEQMWLDWNGWSVKSHKSAMESENRDPFRDLDND